MSDSDSRLDLVLERVVDVPPRLVWAAWTQPEHLKRWFTPAPWRTVEAEVDLRPGGIFRTVMQGPNGERMDNAGCWLEIVEPRRLVWTGALAPGFRPRHTPPGSFLMTAILEFEPQDGGKSTKYTARVLHADEDGRRMHEQMGFHAGWGKALEQLVAVAKTM
jgi:uncharacterized protein YndB with AHSA1/START domain